MARSGWWIGTLVAAGLGLPAGGALAVTPPPHVTRALYTDAGNYGVVIPYRYVGPLGESGLRVEALPTMLLVTAVAPHSPAAKLDLPSPERDRLRLAAVDGVAVDDLPLTALLADFARDRDEVLLTFARKGADDLAEQLIGPYHLALSARAIAGQARSADIQAAHVLLTAQEAGAAGDPVLEAELASRVPTTSPFRGNAVEVHAAAWQARQRELLAHADLLAAEGNFADALATLAGVAPGGTWTELVRLRETEWHKALAARQALRREDERPEAPARHHHSR